MNSFYISGAVFDSPEKILERCTKLAAKSYAVEVMTYGFTDSGVNLLRGWPCKLRVIVGAIGEAEAFARQASRIQTLANSLPHPVRCLYGSHAKLFIFLRGQKTKVAMIGTMNLGLGSQFELAVELHGIRAHSLWKYFERAWNIAVPINPLDVSAAAKALTSGVFEVAGRP